MPQIDLNHYAWKERVGDKDGVRYLTPHADGHVYEYPIDGIFASVKDAVAYLDELLEAEEIDAEERQTLVLIHYTGEIVNVPGDSAGVIADNVTRSSRRGHRPLGVSR